MEITAKQLRSGFKQILKAVDRGEEIWISYRGRIRAKLVPVDATRERPTEITSVPSFGMWSDREDMVDVAAYLDRIRASRF